MLATGEVSEETLADVAARTEDVTASFAKELIRRTVLCGLRRPGGPR